MSYILDALRKADAERERGEVPSIHAQPMFGGAAAPGGAIRSAAPWPWVMVTAALLLLVAAAAWYAIGRGGWGGAVGANVPTPPLAPLLVPATVLAPAAAPAAVVAAPAATAAPASAALARAPQAAPAPRKPRPVATQPAESAIAAPSSAAAGADRVYAIAELPAEIRRQLPAVNVGGSMYSPVAANRIVIINGQVFHEGDRIAPDLVLHQIKPKSAVLAFKGYRYDFTY